MSRLTRTLGALLLTVVVCAGASVGPAFGDTPTPAEPTTSTATEPPPAEPTTTTEPTETPAEPTTIEPTATEPTTTDPTVPAESTTGPTTTAPTTVAPAEPAAEPVAESVDLTLSVAFDKPAFFADDMITATARVTNTGTAAASRVLLDSTGNLADHLWSGFWNHGVRIEPGQTAEGRISTRVTTTDDVLTVVVTARSADEPDVNPDDNTARITATITVVRGTYGGTVYADRNANAVMDPDEPLVGLGITVSGGWPRASYTTTTDQAGRFAFRDLPRGDYQTSFGTEEWWFPRTYFDVDEVDDPNVLIRGRHPIGQLISASATLDQQTYRAPGTARMTMTVTNGGPVPIPGITASCWTNGRWQPDIGELAPGGPGMTVPANGSRTITVSIIVDDKMINQGYLEMGCRLGAPPGENGNITTSVEARVLGGRAPKITGLVAQPYTGPWPGPKPEAFGLPPAGEPVPNVKVYLKDSFTGEVLVRAMTDASGRFAFHDVPAGIHQVGVVGPWRVLGGRFVVTADDDGSMKWEHIVFVVPGPDQPDPDPAPQPGDPSAPAPPGTGPGQQQPAQLAATGANVTWLALGGLLTLLAGVALTVRAGRRRI